MTVQPCNNKKTNKFPVNYAINLALKQPSYEHFKQLKTVSYLEVAIAVTVESDPARSSEVTVLIVRYVAMSLRHGYGVEGAVHHRVNHRYTIGAVSSQHSLVQWKYSTDDAH